MCTLKIPSEVGICVLCMYKISVSHIEESCENVETVLPERIER